MKYLYIAMLVTTLLSVGCATKSQIQPNTKEGSIYNDESVEYGNSNYPKEVGIHSTKSDCEKDIGICSLSTDGIRAKDKNDGKFFFGIKIYSLDGTKAIELIISPFSVLSVGEKEKANPYCPKGSTIHLTMGLKGSEIYPDVSGDS